MIRSSKLTLRFANSGKRSQLAIFVTEYRRVVAELVDLLWVADDLPALLPAETLKLVDSTLSARAKQAAGKQASGVVRGVRQKQKQRLFIVNKLTAEGHLKQAAKLRQLYEAAVISKPSGIHVNPTLDSRFVDIQLSRVNSFDCWLTLSSLGVVGKLQLPLKRNKHLNRLMQAGQLKSSVTISDDAVTLFIAVTPIAKTSGVTLGIDVGKTTVISTSDSQPSTAEPHHHSLTSIVAKLARKKKGSKAFRRASHHRANFVNWTINQLNLGHVKELRREDIKHLKQGRRLGRTMTHWTYAAIFGKLDRYCEDHGVRVTLVNPTYTSQRCSCCGWTRKRNRRGKLFKCDKCDHSQDADENAAVNISLPLVPIWYKQRQEQANRTGFYWLVPGQERIVPAVRQTDPVMSQSL